jgi:hypothetical protein
MLFRVEDYIMGGFTGFYTSKVLLQDTVNGETGGGSSAIRIATGIFSTYVLLVTPIHLATCYLATC